MKPPAPRPPAGQGPGLFASSSTADLIAYIDGGARGNPGPAGYGVVIQDGNGTTVDTLSRSIGRATNNVAEYSGLLAALEYAAEKKAQRVQIFCDSELVVRQMQGRYRVQSPDLKPLHERARALASQLREFRITHVPREQNRLADELANQAMDGALSEGRGDAGAKDISADQHLIAVCEKGLLRPLSPAPKLEEGAEYDMRLRKRR